MKTEANDSRKTPAVHCAGVCVLRGERYLLRDINWQVPAGGVAAVIGPNGAGKSTLTKLLLGYLWPTRGALSVAGRRFGETDIAALRRVVKLVQPSGAVDIDGEATVCDAVGTGFTGTLGVYHKLSAAQQSTVAEMLTQWKISNLADQRYATLSTGERTRVQIARALIDRPQLLLLDEPTAGLDVVASARLLRTIDELLGTPNHPATVVVTHHLEELPAATSSVLLLGGGQVVASGDADAVLTRENLTRAYDADVCVSIREGMRKLSFTTSAS